MSPDTHPTAVAARYAQRVPWLALAFLGLVSSGCTKADIVGGGTEQMTAAPPVDGFLPQPGLLAQREGTLWDLTYMKPGVDFHAYNAILVDPVQILTAPSSQLATLPEDQREKLANTFYSDVFSALSRSCKVAAAPGPGVVRLRLALSDATASNAVVKTVANYTPYVNIAYKATSYAFNNGVGYFSGTATAEGYATDGRTGELLWQGVDRRGGNTPLVQNTTDNWLDVHHAFQAWAAQLVTRLQQMGICPPPS
jgi:hypothetical protein